MTRIKCDKILCFYNLNDNCLYDDGCFWAAGSKSCDYLYGSLKWAPIVVGNIYENRELLNDEDLRILGIEAQVYGK